MYIPAFLLGLDFQSVYILAAFLVVDFFTGVMRAAIVNGGQAVRSSRMGAGALSKALVLTVPVLMVWGGKGAGIDLTWVGQGTISVLVLAELYSILGNIQSIRLRRDIMEFDAVNFIIVKLRDFLETKIKKEHDYK